MITIPGRSSTAAAAGPTQDNTPGPSQAALLMAAAEMQRQGRLTRASDDPVAIDSYRAISKMADPAKFDAAVRSMPPSVNVEDRRESDSDEVLRDFEKMKQRHRR